MMGRNRKKSKSVAFAESETKEQPVGCNCPIGCIVGEVINARQFGAPGLVRIQCSGDNCEAVPYFHEACYDKWEEHLIKMLRRGHTGRSREWSVAQCIHNMWAKKGYELIMHQCYCPVCKAKGKDSFLKKVLEADLIAQTTGFHPPKQETKAKPEEKKKPLKPTLAPATGSKSLFKTGGFVPHDAGSWGKSAWQQRNLMRDQKIRLIPNDEEKVKRHRSRSRRRNRSRSQPPEIDVNPPQEPYRPPENLVLKAQVQHVQGEPKLVSSSNQEEQGFLRFLYAVADSFAPAGLPVDDPIVLEALGKISVPFMTEIEQSGGIAEWISSNPGKVEVRGDCIYALGPRNRDGSSTGQLRNVGEVKSVDREGTTGILWCPGYQIDVSFDQNTSILPKRIPIQAKDLVTFCAYLGKRSGENRGEWRAKEMELLQREDHVTPSSVSQSMSHSGDAPCSSSSRIVRYHRPVESSPPPMDESYMSVSPPDDWADRTYESWDSSFDPYSLHLAPKMDGAETVVPEQNFGSEAAGPAESDDATKDGLKENIQGSDGLVTSPVGRNETKTQGLTTHHYTTEPKNTTKSSLTPPHKEPEKTPKREEQAQRKEPTKNETPTKKEEPTKNETPSYATLPGNLRHMNISNGSSQMMSDDKQRILREQTRRAMEAKIAAMCAKNQSQTRSNPSVGSLSAWIPK